MSNINLKPALTYDEQIDLLIQRGLRIDDRNEAIQILKHTNYYRLSSYSLGLRENDQFIDGVSINHIHQICRFDTELRHLLFQAIEPIEIRLRSVISNHLGTNYGNIAHLDPELVKSKKNHLVFLSKYYEGLSKLSDLAFVKHNINEYGQLPIWAAVETMNLGLISRYYGNLKEECKKPIAAEFNSDPSRFAGWLESLNDIRNSCAHSDRIYNTFLSKKVKLYPGDDRGLNENEKQKIFVIFIIMKKIYSGRNEWVRLVKTLSDIIDQFMDFINMEHLGFPQYWKGRLDRIEPRTNIFN